MILRTLLRTSMILQRSSEFPLQSFQYLRFTTAQHPSGTSPEGTVGLVWIRCAKYCGKRHIHHLKRTKSNDSHCGTAD